MKDHIIICGLGNVGFSTYLLLVAAKERVIVISDKIHDELRWQIEETGGSFYLGDARNDQLLIQAGIRDAKAILALTDEDMTNTTIAMDARNLNPDIKIIIRMTDRELGQYISQTFGIHQIISPADLAAPIFARNIIEDSIIAQFTLNGHSYFINQKTETNTKKKKSSKIRLTNNIYLNKYTNKKMKPNKHSNTIKTNRDEFIIQPIQKTHKDSDFKKQFFKKFNYLRSPAFEHLRLFLFILFCVIITAAFILKWAMPLSYTEALYFVTTTVTTVGYGDINFLNSPPVLKIFGCLLMLTGAAAIAVLFSSITEIILTQKLPSVVGGLPVPKKDHVIIVGAGQIGYRIVNKLLEQHIPVAIIEDKDKNRYTADINHQVALVDGNLCSADTLKRANIKTAKAILIITNDDVENLSISLAVKKLNPDVINIIQIYNEKLGSRLQSVLSLNKILSVASISAPYFAAAVLGEEILVAFKWHDQLIFLSKGKDEQKNLGKNYLRLNDKEFDNIRICSIDLY